MSTATHDHLRPTRTIWVTREGERIPVVQMTDLHLVNTIRYLRRSMGIRLMQALENIEMSDAAESALGNEFDDIGNDDESIAALHPTFQTMLDEAKKRGLQV